MVSGEGGFHEMYTEVEDVLCAVVGIGLPVGAVSKPSQREASISKKVRMWGRGSCPKTLTAKKLAETQKLQIKNAAHKVTAAQRLPALQPPPALSAVALSSCHCHAT